MAPSTLRAGAGDVGGGVAAEEQHGGVQFALLTQPPKRPGGADEVHRLLRWDLGRHLGG
jgi:hypothetical protein